MFGETSKIIIYFVLKFLKLDIVRKRLIGWLNGKWVILGFQKGFNEALKLIKNSSSWLVSNGEKISIWNERWIPCMEGIRKPKSNICPQFNY